MANDDRSVRRVRDLGEQGILQCLYQFCPADLVGDDAATIALTPNLGDSLVVTTDVLVDGVHFSDRTTSPEDAGWRAVAANLSDLAAMGATPIAITVGLALTGETRLCWVEGLYRGMVACLDRYRTAIAGGDVCRSSVNTVSITAFGRADGARIWRRDAARPGDAIVVTGWHGASRAGLELLLDPDRGKALSAEDRADLIRAYQRPKPRLDVREALRAAIAENQHDSQTRSYAAMDTSDGLADAIVQIARASGAGARLERSQLPQPDSLSQLAAPEQALNWVLYGGEDFELVLCLPPAIARSLLSRLDAEARIVGEVTREPGVYLTGIPGSCREQELTLKRGFQHF